jgi:hypothetical protein
MTKLSSLLTSGGLRIIDTQTYSSNATWTKPAGAVLVRVVLCGGGGSGRRPAANATASSGGSAAPMVEMTFPAAGLGATESVVVGAGGAAVTVTDTNGNAGGYSAFGKLEAIGGNGGSINIAPPFSLWHPSSLAASTAASRVGSLGVAPGGSNSGQNNVGFAGAIGIVGGGGGPAGFDNSAVGPEGGASNRHGASSVAGGGGTGGTSGGATGGNGGAGANGEIRIGLGGEGGGAGGGGTTTGGNGGAGGVPGGGGGAGGFGTTTSGDSGAGGAGQVYVETWG